MKKVLILNGSPRKHGYTSDLIETMKCNLNENIHVDVFECHDANVRFCTDCRHCEVNYSCIINDEMQVLYKKIEEADVLVFATPVYFYTVSAQIKAVIDRFQVYFFKHVNKQNQSMKVKEGYIITVGGAKSYTNQFDGVKTVIKGAMGNLNCELKGVYSLVETDNVNVTELETVKDSIRELCKQINI